MEIIQEYDRRQWRNGFGINEREQQYVHMKSKKKKINMQMAVCHAKIKFCLIITLSLIQYLNPKHNTWWQPGVTVVCLKFHSWRIYSL